MQVWSKNVVDEITGRVERERWRSGETQICVELHVGPWSSGNVPSCGITRMACWRSSFDAFFDLWVKNSHISYNSWSSFNNFSVRCSAFERPSFGPPWQSLHINQTCGSGYIVGCEWTSCHRNLCPVELAVWTRHRACLSQSCYFLAPSSKDRRGPVGSVHLERLFFGEIAIPVNVAFFESLLLMLVSSVSKVSSFLETFEGFLHKGVVLYSSITTITSMSIGKLNHAWFSFNVSGKEGGHKLAYPCPPSRSVMTAFWEKVLCDIEIIFTW